MQKKFLSSFQKFIRMEQFSGLLLMGCMVVALAIAHSDFAAAYEKLLQQYSLRHWMNDGLMTIFFFLVGLEIKRELSGGELANPRQALFPVLAALGGMILPAAIFCVFNWSGGNLSGWAIPMATDIAIALGVLSLLGPRVPVSLKLFLSSLAIVDDIGAIAVIALFYSGNLSGIYLFIALLILLATAAATSLLKIRNPLFFLIVLTVTWLCLIPSGIHATLAGVLSALLVPGKAALYDERQESPLKVLEEKLHPWVAFGILPTFVLVNAGVRMTGDLAAAFQNPLFISVFAGLLVGKPLGIIAFTGLGCWLNWAEKPANIAWSHIAGVGFVAGIGFTMSLFIGDLSFLTAQVQGQTAKLAVIFASVAAAVLGLAVLNRTLHKVNETNRSI